MMLGRAARRVQKFLTLYIYSQLIVTLFSLPILLSWGLPISYMATVGNLIFSPVLTAFLLLSSLIFITEVFCIPNGIFIYLLERNTDIMNFLLGLGQKSWLVSFCKPHPLFFVIVIGTTAAVMHHPKVNTLKRRMVTLAILLGLSLVYLSVNTYLARPECAIVPTTKDKLLVDTCEDGSLILIDNGQFNTKASPDKWVQFDLRAYLIKTFGTTHIARLEILKPGYRSFVGAKEAITLLKIQTLYIPYFEKLSNKRAWKSFFELLEAAKRQKVAILREI